MSLYIRPKCGYENLEKNPKYMPNYEIRNKFIFLTF